MEERLELKVDGILRRDTKASKIYGNLSVCAVAESLLTAGTYPTKLVVILPHPQNLKKVFDGGQYY
jgi:hypothetical protein